MKKTRVIVVSILLIVCLMLISFINNRIKVADNLLLIDFRTTLSMEEIGEIKEFRTPDLVDISIYNRRAKEQVDYLGRTIGDISVYEVDENYIRLNDIKMLKGRFIWDSDFETGKNFAVIDHKLAQRLFSAVDVIGSSISVGGREYIVCGVYEKSDDIADLFTSVERTAVYVPYSNFPSYYGNSTAVVRAKEGTTAMLQRLLKSNLDKYGGGINTIANIGMEYKLALQKLKLLYFLMYLTVLYLSFKCAFKGIKKHIAFCRKNSSSYYFKEMIIAYKKQHGFVIVSLILYGVLIVVLYINLSFKIIADPAIIPSSLIDLREFVEKLRVYFISANNSDKIFNSMYYLVSWGSSALSFLCIFAYIAFFRLVKYFVELLEYYEPVGLLVYGE